MNADRQSDSFMSLEIVSRKFQPHSGRHRPLTLQILNADIPVQRAIATSGLTRHSGCKPATSRSGLISLLVSIMAPHALRSSGAWRSRGRGMRRLAGPWARSLPSGRRYLSPLSEPMQARGARITVAKAGPIAVSTPLNNAKPRSPATVGVARRTCCRAPTGNHAGASNDTRPVAKAV